MSATTQQCRIRRMNEQLDDYRIVELIGSGGAARTYEAHHRRTGRRVALKTLSPEAAREPRIVEAFLLEAKLASELSHPNLAACVDVDLDATPPWIAFELIEGTSLVDAIEDNDFLDPVWATNLAIDIAYGLAAAHQKDILHRDVKPSNVMFSTDGRVKLIDFGAALHDPSMAEPVGCGGARARSSSTESGPTGFAGTLLYASPEQLKGEELDCRSDLYSLGLVLYEMLTGIRLLQPDPEATGLQPHMQIFAQQATLEATMTPPSALRPGIPVELDRIVAGLLAFRARDRAFATALELVDALQAVLQANGWVNPRTEAERRMAHHELAEVAYWRARSALDEGRYTEAVQLLTSLLRHPNDIALSYERAVREGLEALFTAQCLAHVRQEPGLGTLLDWLAAFRSAADGARMLADQDLVALAERRFLTVVDWLNDQSDRVAAVARYVADHPTSVAAGLRAVELLGGGGRDDECDQARAALARACLVDGWHSRALGLLETIGADAALRNDVLAPVRDALGPWKLFDRVRRNLRRLGHHRERVMLCRRFLDDHPGNREAWLELADGLALTGDRAGAAEAFFQAARLAFGRDQLDEARQLLARVLDMTPDHEQAYRYLFEVLYAQGRLPTAFANAEQLRAGILCRERLVGPLRLALDDDDASLDDDFLHQLHDVAEDNGDRATAAEIKFRLGRLSLGRRSWDEGLEYFLSSLETAPEPTDVLRRMEALPDIRRLFTPLELLNLRRDVRAGRLA